MGFGLNGTNGFIKIRIQELYDIPHYTSGWDARGDVEIECDHYKASGEIYFSTGQIDDFYQQLKKCQDIVKGTANFENYELNLKFTLTYDSSGHVSIEGSYQEYPHRKSKLYFEIDSDQSFFNETLKQLRKIIKEYEHKVIK
ncbi:MAG: hypothetical protein HPY50_08975 [Firmicutes bacterium]|nr:hypothetical protein [Bacillota bacterium]